MFFFGVVRLCEGAIMGRKLYFLVPFKMFSARGMIYRFSRRFRFLIVRFWGGGRLEFSLERIRKIRLLLRMQEEKR